ncbi:hypothetical protein GO613_08340 [Azoarcus communis]|uniref:hypothetical protein n=1 Tax=Parazoarcus communis TaxID=41977 RepID=UPI0014593C0D|nr:hypothetical protein [Parazoarcus communis]NMG48106.1 hypothetical protein [Parazoarcus communis]
MRLILNPLVFFQHSVGTQRAANGVIPFVGFFALDFELKTNVLNIFFINFLGNQKRVKFIKDNKAFNSNRTDDVVITLDDTVAHAACHDEDIKKARPHSLLG